MKAKVGVKSGEPSVAWDEARSSGRNRTLFRIFNGGSMFSTILCFCPSPRSGFVCLLVRGHISFAEKWYLRHRSGKNQGMRDRIEWSLQEVTGRLTIKLSDLKFRRGQHRDRYHLVNVLFEIQKCPKSNVDAVLTFASLQSKQSGSRYQQNRHFFEERLRLSEMQLEEIISTLLLVGSSGRRRLETNSHDVVQSSFPLSSISCTYFHAFTITTMRPPRTLPSRPLWS